MDFGDVTGIGCSTTHPAERLSEGGLVGECHVTRWGAAPSAPIARGLSLANHRLEVSFHFFDVEVAVDDAPVVSNEDHRWQG